MAATRGAAPLGWRIDRLDTVDSTNDEARRRAVAGDPGRLWIVADEQTAGRGRRGRVWVSPPGNLYASALLIDPCPPAALAATRLRRGRGARRAARGPRRGAGAAQMAERSRLGGAKCAGLLLEGVGASRRRLACVVGIGVNCVHAPEGVGYPTATLGARDGGAIERSALLRAACRAV